MHRIIVFHIGDFAFSIHRHSDITFMNNAYYGSDFNDETDSNI